MKSNVVTQIVKNDLCIGCGVCSAMCPHNALKMQFNDYGELNPKENDSCIKCCICLKVCPFFPGNPNEDVIADKLFKPIRGIKHTAEIGYWLTSYVGYSNVDDHRANGASGGMATWFLETLLAAKVVDYIICVQPESQGSSKLFKFRIVDKIEDVRASSGSAYYPVELSDVLQKIKEKEGRYAIIALPCFIKGVRLATSHDRILKERISFCAGLVCGQMKSRNFTSYLARLAGVENNLKSVHYRCKSKDKPATDYYYSFRDDADKEGKIFWSEGIAEAWVNRWFTPNSCNYCDDVFAESADIAFMDAWLKEYSQDSKGTSLIITRNNVADSILKDGIKQNNAILSSMPIEKVIQSQAGVLNVKREQLSYRLFLAHKRRLCIPNKRVKPSCHIGSTNKINVILTNSMQNVSRKKFPLFNIGNQYDAIKFQKNVNRACDGYLLWSKVCRKLKGYLNVLKLNRVENTL